MKQLVEFESWIDNVINEAPRMGQVDKSMADRPIARSQDIVYQAQRKYPDRSTDQALSLYINDKMVDSEKMDLEQNKLINSQKRENEKLRRSLTDLSNELHSHEQTAMDTEKEVQRLRDLSSKLKPAGELQQQLVKASSEQLEKMLSDLNQIKSKSNIDEKQFKQLQSEIEKAKEGTSKQNLQNLMAMMGQLSQQQVDTSEFSAILNNFKKFIIREQQENNLQAAESAGRAIGQATAAGSREQGTGEAEASRAAHRARHREDRSQCPCVRASGARASGASIRAAGVERIARIVAARRSPAEGRRLLARGARGHVAPRRAQAQ